MFWHLFKLLHVYLGCYIDAILILWLMNEITQDNHLVLVQRLKLFVQANIQIFR